MRGSALIGNKILRCEICRCIYTEIFGKNMGKHIFKIIFYDNAELKKNILKSPVKDMEPINIFKCDVIPKTVVDHKMRFIPVD